MKRIVFLIAFIVITCLAQGAGQRKFTRAEDAFLKELTKELEGKVKRNEPGKRDIRIDKYIPQSVVQLTLTVLVKEDDNVGIDEPWFLVQEGEKSIATVLRVLGKRIVISYDDELKLLICMTLGDSPSAQ
ncbi:hypothetical protein [Mangrovibacterium diazotrophicum]|uniref:Uncharacterized protein n=1 Tax=Mangrovibacterium diazotrophicum TaxID=1261403 RepID=A0A419W6J9_9BACT|nr:hypothetical protein [Mangrovibacterium diazotrophicum]RKD91088.1 hypothetical protein BC643_1437 [Mangrovibacterium diazotrophicum]